MVSVPVVCVLLLGWYRYRYLVPVVCVLLLVWYLVPVVCVLLLGWYLWTGLVLAACSPVDELMPVVWLLSLMSAVRQACHIC